MDLDLVMSPWIREVFSAHPIPEPAAPAGMQGFEARSLGAGGRKPGTIRLPSQRPGIRSFELFATEVEKRQVFDHGFPATSTVMETS